MLDTETPSGIDCALGLIVNHVSHGALPPWPGRAYMHTVWNTSLLDEVFFFCQFILQRDAPVIAVIFKGRKIRKQAKSPKLTFERAFFKSILHRKSSRKKKKTQKIKC